MSGSAKFGLLGILLMIVFIAVVWDRENEVDLSRRSTEVIVLPEPAVLTPIGVGTSLAARGGETASSSEGPARARGAARIAPRERRPEPEELERLIEALRPVPPPVAAPSSQEGSEVKEARSTPEYVVREGETLWTIAQGVYGDGGLWGRLHRANRDRIADPDRLTPGQRLICPGARRSKRSTGPALARPVLAPRRYHVVRKGETLFGISRTTLGSGALWEKLLEVNRGRIQDPTRLPPGTRLVIPQGVSSASEER